ncbi:lysophospholipid acyltransferase family protein [Cryptosporangium phraense]|uniref:1-acyl-sn-glycerol-3-phosphate acyltransferase n=1 Tax=Cryptosporangium phraense TaxID=2593070 RepID=A0A545AFZ5_9ACTN|nr:lysophospholipid acyltransferase family protein [Cryptosporangium phraense]TQS40256.1 1-acyl-sn-glycerol-3-phosphate acyltransferase [Cryptosporangium phraense]
MSVSPVDRSGYLYWVFKVLLTGPMTLYFRPHVEGIEHVPRHGPVILACNHVSYLDWLLLPLVVRSRRISFLAKQEYFVEPGLRGRWKKYFFTATGQVPVLRVPGAGDAALNTAAGLLAGGRVVGIFPEGTRTRDGRLYRGRTGLARIAAATGAPVVPCATVGVFELAPPGARFPRPGRVTVRFAPAITWDAPEDALRERTDQLMDVIQKLSGQEYAGVDAVLPGRDN